MTPDWEDAATLRNSYRSFLNLYSSYLRANLHNHGNEPDIPGLHGIAWTAKFKLLVTGIKNERCDTVTPLAVVIIFAADPVRRVANATGAARTESFFCMVGTVFLGALPRRLPFFFSFLFVMIGLMYFTSKAAVVRTTPLLMLL